MSEQHDTEWIVNQIAHALRNPIFAAMVQVDAISLKASSDAGLQRPLSTLSGQLQRLEAVLEEMLLFGRPARIEPRPVQVAALLAEIAMSYGEGARGGEPAQVEVAPIAPAVEATWDPNAVRIVLERILDNAVQHTEPPHRIEVRVDVADEAVVLRVADRGRGIAADILEKATAPFYPQHRGRPGLGLAVAEKMTAALGGSLEIESVPDEGTTVAVTLPLHVSV